MPPVRNSQAGGRLDSMVGLAREPVFLLTADRRFALVNRAWEELTGHTEAEVLGLECRPHGPTRAGDLAGLGGSFAPPLEALAGQPTGGRTLIIRRGGDRIQRRVEFWPWHDATGQLTGLLGIVRPSESPPIAADSAKESLRFALLDLRARLHARHAHDALIGQGAEHRRVLDGVAAAAAATIPVTIVGEPGTGKRFVARLIHAQGARRQSSLLGYDCQAIPAEILERELFGGPLAANPTGGLVAPEGATIVVGDILALPRDLQARLAASLLAGPRSARLIATTAGDLDGALREDRLHPDLGHLLSTLVIRLRPLRDRADDLPLLAQSLLERVNLRGQTHRSGWTPAALDVLLAYDWPGNLRELSQVVDEAHAQAQGDMITPDDLAPRIRGERAGAFLPPTRPAPPVPLKNQLLAFERQVIEDALTRTHQNKTKAARRLGVNRPFLYRRIKELGIEDADTGAADDEANPTAEGPALGDEPTP